MRWLWIIVLLCSPLAAQERRFTDDELRQLGWKQTADGWRRIPEAANACLTCGRIHKTQFG